MTFSGFARPTTTDTPDELFDLIMPRIDNLAELKCVMYVIRVQPWLLKAGLHFSASLLQAG